MIPFSPDRFDAAARQALWRKMKKDENGRVTAVAMDVDNGEPLMLAFMDETAFLKTLETGQMHYYSRSRNALWHKGETSGHIQEVRSVRVDCDADALLFYVTQTGAACHTGNRSCFYRDLTELIE